MKNVASITSTWKSITNIYLANCINNDLINEVEVPGLIKSDTNINIKNCLIYDVPNVRNFIIAHRESSHVDRKKKDIFNVDIETCRDMIGASSSITKFQRLSQTFSQHNLPKEGFILDDEEH